VASWRVVSHKFSPGQRLYYEWNAESRCQQYSWPCNWRWVEKVVVVRGHRPPQKPTSVPITISTAAGRVCDVIRGQLAPSRRYSERLRVWAWERSGCQDRWGVWIWLCYWLCHDALFFCVISIENNPWRSSWLCQVQLKYIKLYQTFLRQDT